LIKIERDNNPRFNGIYLIKSKEAFLIIYELGTLCLCTKELKTIWSSEIILLHSEVKITNNIIHFKNQLGGNGKIDMRSGCPIK